MSEEPNELHIEKEVKIRRVNPDKILSTYVNDMLVSHTEGEIFLTFSVLEPVGITDPEEVKTLESVDAIARVKLVLTPAFARRVSNALAANLDRHETKSKKAETK